jgi:hypothetical protein
MARQWAPIRDIEAGLRVGIATVAEIINSWSMAQPTVVMDTYNEKKYFIPLSPG